MSPDDDRKRDGREPRGRSRRRAPSKGAAHHQQAQRGRHGAGGDRANRKRVPPAIRIGVAVEPAEVADRSRQFRVLEADAGTRARSPTGSSRRGSTALPRDSPSTCASTACSRITPRRSSRSWAEVRDAALAVGAIAAPAVRRRPPGAALDLALDRFLASVQPVHEFGKLGAVVFPFPSYFQPSTKALRLPRVAPRAGR